MTYKIQSSPHCRTWPSDRIDGWRVGNFLLGLSMCQTFYSIYRHTSWSSSPPRIRPSYPQLLVVLFHFSFLFVCSCPLSQQQSRKRSSRANLHNLPNPFHPNASSSNTQSPVNVFYPSSQCYGMEWNQMKWKVMAGHAFDSTRISFRPTSSPTNQRNDACVCVCV